MTNTHDCIVLFSGGLDSLLAAKLLQKQGLNPLCVHFYSPFFGAPNKVEHWQGIYDLDIQPVDASLAFLDMLVNSPPHGTGKTLNPCIDCKIVLLRLAHEMMESRGAQFIATGEVTGQRPMSQRPDAMHIIAKESGCQNALLRPLCAKHCPPVSAPISNLVNLDGFPAISGRGRTIQLQLAHELGIAEIPAPAGGCRLTEIENSRRYWTILKRYGNKIGSQILSSLARDFSLANFGRMFMDLEGGFRHWLCVGRNKADNQRIADSRNECDILLRLPFPGPLALCRDGHTWPREKLREAAEILASCSTRPGGNALNIRIDDHKSGLRVYANRHVETWGLPDWQDIREELRSLRRQKNQSRISGRDTMPLHDKDVSAIADSN